MSLIVVKWLSLSYKQLKQPQVTCLLLNRCLISLKESSMREDENSQGKTKNPEKKQSTHPTTDQKYLKKTTSLSPHL